MTRLNFISDEKLFIDVVKKYVVKTASSFAVMHNFYELSETYEVTCDITNKNEDNIFLEIETKLTDQIASNEDFKYTFGLLSLFQTLRLTTDLKGNIINVHNLGHIRDEWVEQRYDLKRKYRKQKDIDEHLTKIDQILQDETKLETFIKHNGSFPVLLKPVFLDSLSFPFQEKAILPEFLGTDNLPIEKEVKIKDHTSSDIILVEGSIDTKEFDKRPFTKWLKEETDIYDLKVALELDYEEQYEYKNNLLVSAEQYMAVGVMGCFSNTIARTLVEKEK